MRGHREGNPNRAGLEFLFQVQKTAPHPQSRSNANAAALGVIVAATDYLGFLAADPAIRSKTSVCLTVKGADEAMIKKMASLLEAEDAAYDIAGYRDAPPGLRIWCGATVDTADIQALGPWLDWAYHTAKA